METFLEQFQQLKVQLKDIKSATDDFSNSKVIGTGGFGKVYIGELSHFQGGSKAAFKRLDRRFGQGDPEFWKEIMMLSRYTHENLISLLGFCDEDGEKILIYEYASNGSLDLHLRSTTFTWIQRLKVCLDAAKGLSYLHDDKGTQQRILHRDIKSSNILLDDNWNAKVSDMGLSKVGPANQPHTAIITNVVGTIGYLDPLYMELGILTKESDVYSFGVVLFEVLCGRLCFEHGNGRFMSLVRMWKQNYKNKKLNEIIFQDLMQEMDPGSLEAFTDIAFQCLQKYREKRPTMSLVVEKLKIALELQENCEWMKNPLDYEKIIKTAVYPLKYKSEEELKSSLSKGILLNRDKTVAKEASDMVLADDDISTTVAAVGEGRSTYNNLKPFIRYMIASNIAEVAPIFLTAAIGIPEGLIPVQLLWVKLVTYGPPATALAFNPPNQYIMKKAPRRSDDSQISAWILFRYLVIGLYVGIATVGVFVIWYTSNSFFGIDLSQDGHTLVTYSQLANWVQCKTWDKFTVLPFRAGNQVFNFDSNPCDYFQGGKVKAMTLSLSVLVSIEMFNSLNALTEDESLLTMPPWVNPWLLVAVSVSFGLHFIILYVPFLAQVFGIVPLSFNEWLLVLAVALPVKLIDEVLKFVGQLTNRTQPDRRPSKGKTE